MATARDITQPKYLLGTIHECTSTICMLVLLLTLLRRGLIAVFCLMDDGQGKPLISGTPLSCVSAHAC